MNEAERPDAAAHGPDGLDAAPGTPGGRPSSAPRDSWVNEPVPTWGIPSSEDGGPDFARMIEALRLGRFYLGTGGAAHGGALGLVFDELLGRLANTGRAGRGPRTCT